jgi:hypothetical protein
MTKVPRLGRDDVGLVLLLAVVLAPGLVNLLLLWANH